MAGLDRPVHRPRAADAALETNEKSGGGPEAEDRETVVCHQAPAAPSQQICKRARADQFAPDTALAPRDFSCRRRDVMAMEGRGVYFE